jgi:hypothetical protein
MPFGMNLLPGEDDWLKRVMGGGMATPPFFPGQTSDQPGVPMPTPVAATPERAGLLGRLDKATAPFGGALPLGLSLLANSGNTGGAGFGEVFGRSALQAQQMGQERTNDELRQQYIKAQIEAMKTPKDRAPPASVAEYEYAKQNGFKGTFQEWVVAGGQSSRPSAVLEWEHYMSLPPDQRAMYLEMKRNPNVFVKDVETVPTVIRPGTVGAPTATTPLSTRAGEAAAAAEKKRAETEGGKIGEAQGGVAGGIITKGSNAKGTISTLDLADPLIDAATGSLAGAGRDRLAAVFGAAPEGAQAIAQLRVLQANLMTSMPRMEGPQSDRDVELYRQAAGQIGDPTVPAPLKKAAVKTIRQLQDKYIERASGSSGGPKQIKKSVGGKNYVQIDGQWYEDDGT